jgi:hypothetical protein
MPWTKEKRYGFCEASIARCTRRVRLSWGVREDSLAPRGRGFRINGVGAFCEL